MTIAEAYSPGRPNVLNAIRLLLAAGVIFWHSFPLGGFSFDGGAPLAQLLGYGFVDGFFVISGFLITRSWLRTPNVRAYLAARALRLLPAFWVCLAVTAYIAAPLSALLVGDDAVEILTSGNTLAYVLKNFGLVMLQYGIDGTLSAVPYSDVWNGSLWTLAWEFACYLGILALGVMGLLRRTWTLGVVFALAWLVTIVNPAIISDGIPAVTVRFALVFLAGAMLAKLEKRIPLSWIGVAASACVVAASLWLPNYRVLAAPALAYGLVAMGGLISVRRLALRNDISYGVYIYAFPAQQLIASAGLAIGGPVAFWLVSSAATLPLAIASWFAVEKPAIRLRKRVPSASQVGPATSPDAAT